MNEWYNFDLGAFVPPPHNPKLHSGDKVRLMKHHRIKEGSVGVVWCRLINLLGTIHYEVVFDGTKFTIPEGDLKFLGSC